jgi:hypothetical protein
MRDFVRESIQGEHGSLSSPKFASKSLHYSANITAESKYPLSSSLGLALYATDQGKGLIDDTAARAEGNLAWARLRLDDLCKAESIDDTLLRKDRLPRNLVELFDAGIALIEEEHEDVAKVGLRSILLAAEDESREEDGMIDECPGIPFSSLADDLCDLEEGSPFPPSLEEVLHATRGFLKSYPLNAEMMVTVYHKDFRLYVRERYNKRLEQERSTMVSLKSQEID